jgi:hypothetical protein
MKGLNGERNCPTSEPSADEIKTTTCYMCAGRCGIRVHLKDGKVRYIDGNQDHPVNRGVLCGKGSAGIMQHYSPARLRAPLLRVGPRGSGELKEISWDEGSPPGGSATCDGRTRGSLPSSPAATRASRSRAGGPCSSARPTMRHMAASAR